MEQGTPRRKVNFCTLITKPDFLWRSSLDRLPNDANLSNSRGKQGKEDLAREVEVRGKE